MPMAGRRSALVVANDVYLDPGLQQLRSPGQDAAALSEVLGDPAIGQFELTVVRNARVQELREKLDEFFSAAARSDELLVHFSCHGLKDDANDLYLAATDTRANLLASTGLPADFVARRMRASRARSIALFLDCCYGGAFERGMLARAGSDVPVLDSFGQNQLAEGAGRVVVTASSAVEYAFESGDLTDAGQARPSVFTSAIVDGITSGDADSDGTGTISVRELFAYAERRVRRENPQQTPHLWSFGTRGDIVVARTPLRRIVPAALPVAVQTALAGDRISRLGAVHVLSELLDEAGPADALAAVQALQYLVDDDSKSLSEAAVATLRRVRLTADPATVTVEAGTAQSVPIMLGGSVLAVAARVVTVPTWIHAKQVGGQLILTIDTATPTEGSVSIEGPTGTVTIKVNAVAAQAAAASPPQPVPPPDEPPPPTTLSPSSPQTPIPPPQAPIRPKPLPQKASTEGRSSPLGSPFVAAQAGSATLSRLWLAAAVCEFAELLMGLSGGIGVVIWGPVLLVAICLLAASAGLSRKNPTNTLLVIGSVATGLSTLFAAVIIGLVANEGFFFGVVVAVVGALLAIIALIQTIRLRGSAPTG